MDPADALAYTYSEFVSYYSERFDRATIDEYWMGCHPDIAKTARRVDPSDGACYTYKELANYYKDKFSMEDIDIFWKSCQPEDKHQQPLRRCVVIPEPEHAILVPVTPDMTARELLAEVIARSEIPDLFCLSILHDDSRRIALYPGQKISESTAEHDIIFAELRDEKDPASEGSALEGGSSDSPAGPPSAKRSRTETTAMPATLPPSVLRARPRSRSLEPIRRRAKGGKQDE